MSEQKTVMTDSERLDWYAIHGGEIEDRTPGDPSGCRIAMVWCDDCGGRHITIAVKTKTAQAGFRNAIDIAASVEREVRT